MQSAAYLDAEDRLGHLSRKRREILRRALGDAQRRLGRMVLASEPKAPDAEIGALVPDDLQGMALLVALKIRDLSSELDSARLEGPLPWTSGP